MPMSLLGTHAHSANRNHITTVLLCGMAIYYLGGSWGEVRRQLFAWNPESHVRKSRYMRIVGGEHTT